MSTKTRIQPRVLVNPELFVRLKKESEKSGLKMSEIVAIALEKHFNNKSTR